MATRMLTRTVAAVAGFGIALGAGVIPAEAAATGRATVTIRSTSKHVVQSPDTLRPGRVRLHNGGTNPLLVLRTKNTDPRDFVKVLHIKNPRKARAAMRQYKIVEFLFPDSDDIIALHRGAYLLFDPIVGKPKAGKIGVLHVKGKRLDTRIRASARLGASGHRPLSGSKSAPHHPWTTFVNHGSNAVVFTYLRVSRSASENEVQDFIAHPSRSHLLDNWDSRIYSTPVYVFAHTAVTHRVDLPKGRYFVLADDFSDRALRPGDVKLVSLG